MHTNASNGRMHNGPILTTDIIIEYDNGSKEGIVLITRKNFPYGIALPGGFAEKGLTLEQNAIKEAMEETNLRVEIETPEHPLCVHSQPDRDPRDHMVAVTYIAKGKGLLRGGDDAKSAGLYSIEEVIGMLGCGKFAFPDHERMIVKYLRFRGHYK